MTRMGLGMWLSYQEWSEERCKSVFTIKYKVNGSLERVQSQAYFQRYI